MYKTLSPNSVSKQSKGNLQWLAVQNTLNTYTEQPPGVKMCKVRKCEAGCCWKRAYLLYILRQLFLAKQIFQHFKSAWEGKWADAYKWLCWVKLHWHWKTAVTKTTHTVDEIWCFLVSESGALSQASLNIQKTHTAVNAYLNCHCRGALNG